MRRKVGSLRSIASRFGRFLIEYLVNLKALTRPRVQFFAVPIKIEGGDGAPARAFAVLD